MLNMSIAPHAWDTRDVKLVYDTPAPGGVVYSTTPTGGSVIDVPRLVNNIPAFWRTENLSHGKKSAPTILVINDPNLYDAFKTITPHLHKKDFMVSFLQKYIEHDIYIWTGTNLRKVNTPHSLKTTATIPATDTEILQAALDLKLPVSRIQVINYHQRRQIQAEMSPLWYKNTRTAQCLELELNDFFYNPHLAANLFLTLPPNTKIAVSISSPELLLANSASLLQLLSRLAAAYQIISLYINGANICDDGNSNFDAILRGICLLDKELVHVETFCLEHASLKLFKLGALFPSLKVFKLNQLVMCNITSAELNWLTLLEEIEIINTENVELLSLTFPKLLHYKAIVPFNSSAPQLQSFHNDYHTTDLTEMAKNFPNLEALSLGRINITDEKALYFPTLKKLKLNKFCSLSIRDIAYILKACPQLQELECAVKKITADENEAAKSILATVSRTSLRVLDISAATAPLFHILQKARVEKITLQSLDIGEVGETCVSIANVTHLNITINFPNDNRAIRVLC